MLDDIPDSSTSPPPSRMDSRCPHLHHILFLLILIFIPKFANAADRCVTPADVTLLIDNSGSITENNAPGNWELMKRFIKGIVYELNIGSVADRVAAVSFSTTAYVEWHLDSYGDINELVAAIDRLYYAGSRTNIAQALNMAYEQVYVGQRGDRYNTANIVILVTDGKANEWEDLTYTYARQLKEIATIVAVGITDLVDEEELREIASNPDDVITVQQFSELVDILDRLIYISCPTPEPPCETSAVYAIDREMLIAILFFSVSSFVGIIVLMMMFLPIYYGQTGARFRDEPRT